MAKASTPTLDPGSPAAPSAPVSFETALRELETIVQTMEAGNSPLEESLAAYERGIVLLRQCQETLTAAEQKIRILEDGTLRDFNAAREGGTEG